MSDGEYQQIKISGSDTIFRFPKSMSEGDIKKVLETTDDADIRKAMGPKKGQAAAAPAKYTAAQGIKTGAEELGIDPALAKKIGVGPAIKAAQEQRARLLRERETSQYLHRAGEGQRDYDPNLVEQARQAQIGRAYTPPKPSLLEALGVPGQMLDATVGSAIAGNFQPSMMRGLAERMGKEPGGGEAYEKIPGVYASAARTLGSFAEPSNLLLYKGLGTALKTATTAQKIAAAGALIGPAAVGSAKKALSKKKAEREEGVGELIGLVGGVGALGAAHGIAEAKSPAESLKVDISPKSDPALRQLIRSDKPSGKAAKSYDKSAGSTAAKPVGSLDAALPERLRQAKPPEPTPEPTKKGTTSPAQSAKVKKATSTPPDTTGLTLPGAGKAIAEGLYDALWEKAQKGETKEAGQPSAVLQAAKMARSRGGLQTREEFKSFAQEVNDASGKPDRNTAIHAVVDKYTPKTSAKVSPAGEVATPEPVKGETNVQIGSTEKTVPSTATGGENLPGRGKGVRRGEQGQAVARTSSPEAKSAKPAAKVSETAVETEEPDYDPDAPLSAEDRAIVNKNAADLLSKVKPGDTVLTGSPLSEKPGRLKVISVGKGSVVMQREGAMTNGKPFAQVRHTLKDLADNDAENYRIEAPAEKPKPDTSGKNASALLQHLEVGKPTHIDEIAKKAGVSVTQAGIDLTMLELDGKVRRLPGNNYDIPKEKPPPTKPAKAVSGPSYGGLKVLRDGKEVTDFPKGIMPGDVIVEPGHSGYKKGDTVPGRADTPASLPPSTLPQRMQAVADEAKGKTETRSETYTRFRESGLEPQKAYEATNKIHGEPVKTPENRFGEGEVELHGGLGLPGLPKSVVDAAKAAAAKLGEIKDELKSYINPAGVDEAAGKTARSIRSRNAERAQFLVRAHNATKAMSRAFDRLPEADRLAFINRMENGSPQARPELQPAADALRELLDAAKENVRALGKGHLENAIENYFPHIWKDPKAAEAYYGQARRPLEGAKSFLRKRSIDSVADGIAAGLEPVTTNPVELVLLKLGETQKYVMGQRVFAEMKENGLATLHRGGKIPEGYERINDKIARVVERRPTIKKGGDEGAPEYVLHGEYIAPEGAARVLNNYLSPGLGGSKVFRGARFVNNALNQAQLGLSAFHFTFTALDTTVSKMALGIKQVADGKPIAGAATVGKSMIPGYAPLEAYLRGNKLGKAYMGEKTPSGLPMGDDLRNLVESGGRFQMEANYRTGAVDAFRKALDTAAMYKAEGKTGARIGQFAKAGAISPFAAIEAASIPLFENAVPRLKLGVFAQLAEHEYGRLVEEANKTGTPISPDAYRKAMARTWDSVDNRLGQLVYDNLFWNRMAVDAGQIATRSLGWNLGSVREIGGGVLDFGEQGVKGVKNFGELGKSVHLEMTPRMSYVIALPVTVGMTGAVMQYLMTGERPKELKDYFYPRTGRTNRDGTPERVQIASYIKDVKGFATSPLSTISGKKGPLLSTLGEMVANEDWYGDKIRNTDDPIVKQMQEEAAYVAKQFLPFSLREQKRRAGEEETPQQKIGRFFGVTKAPADIDRSAKEREIMKYRGEKAKINKRGRELGISPYPPHRPLSDTQKERQRDRRERGGIKSLLR